MRHAHTSSMDFSEEWKSLWPISSVFSPPLLALAEDHLRPPASKCSRLEGREEEGEKTQPQIGPLVFIPLPETCIELFSSTALSPRLPPPYPVFSLSRFLDTSAPSILPSTSTRIASQFGPQTNISDEIHNSHCYLHCFNHLQLLPIPASSVVAFFPTGENCDQVGFVLLRIKDCQVSVELSHGNGTVFTANDKLNYRISRLLVNPVAEMDDFLSSGWASTSSSFTSMGYLMACSMYSVHWYVVKGFMERDSIEAESVKVDFVGRKLFKSCAIVHACWSPHLSEESMVLLETGELFLFDLSPCLKKPLSSNSSVCKKKLQVLWNVYKKVEDDGGGDWLSCEFSWHPRIVIVACSSAVFLVDARSEGCNVSCLLKIEMLSTVQNDGFVALSRAGSDGFSFCVASKGLLFLSDVRQPWRPLLQWLHNLDNPHYITVFGLSKLRSNIKDGKYKWASESGSCILLGSFWDCEFSIFIYGPNDNRASVSSEISKFYNSFYAWGLPSELSLSGHDYHSGSCLLREELSKDSLPDWVDWRQKKDVILGFGILDRDHFAQLSEPDNLGGFLLIRLISSGKLEAQTYSAIWAFHRTNEAPNEKLLQFENNLMFDREDSLYDLEKKFQHLTLDYIEGYLNGNLAEVLAKKIMQLQNAVLEKEAKKESFKKLETDGHTGLRSLSGILKVLKDINLPTSIHEIALRNTWAGLRMIFSCSSEFPEVSQGISNHMLQFPFQIPLRHSNKFSHKIRLSNELLGTSLPPQFLLTLHNLGMEELISKGKLDREKVNILSADAELEFQCDRIMEVADELSGSCSRANSELYDGHAVSLSDDADELRNDTENLNNLCFHQPGTLNEIHLVDVASVRSGSGNKRFTKFICRKNLDISCNVNMEMAGLELLNTGCPLELKFDNNAILFGQKELKTFKLLKQQDLNFQQGFQLYQEYATRVNLEKEGI